MTYRINAGTVAFLGYDDRYRQGRRIDELLFPTAALQRTNRAVFGKLFVSVPVLGARVLDMMPARTALNPRGPGPGAPHEGDGR